MFSEPALEQLAIMLRRYPHVWVIVDEIYAELCYDGQQARSLLSVAPDLRERVVIVDGVSKTYAMTGFRVGWLLAPRPLATACATLQSQGTNSIATVAQLAALAALRGDQACVQGMLCAYVERRDRLVRGLNELPGVHCDTPHAAFYLFADVRALIGKRAGDRVLTDDVEIADWLLSCAGVAVIPGTAFGGPGYLRVSYAAALRDIDAALERLRAAVARLV
jgi:aspartate aminotransferase